MSATLAHFAEHGPASTYESLKRRFMRAQSQINTRRAMLARIRANRQRPGPAASNASIS
jgi:hypothetical protein